MWLSFSPGENHWTLFSSPQWGLPGPGAGSGLRRHGRLLPYGAAEQQRLLPPPRRLRLLRRPLRSLHNAPPRKQTQISAGLPEGR